MFMSTVAEIEAAVKKLPEKELEQVVFTVMERLRKLGNLPPLRKFNPEQVLSWIREDEKDMAAFRQVSDSFS